MNIAGFYSVNLVKYLVKVLNMNPANIKYKILTNTALKPGTFKSFAKLLANCYIGNLGVKYNKTNNETALNMWTAAISENLNISIDHYNDLYFIKEQKVERSYSGLWFQRPFYVHRTSLSTR